MYIVHSYDIFNDFVKQTTELFHVRLVRIINKNKFNVCRTKNLL